MPAASSGVSSPLPAASTASFRTAVMRTLMETDPSPRASSATRQALTVAFVKPGRASWPYHAKKSSSPKLGLDSYDRFFPNQDTMSKGGLGNLIALPLQFGAA